MLLYVYRHVCCTHAHIHTPFSYFSFPSLHSLSLSLFSLSLSLSLSPSLCPSFTSYSSLPLSLLSVQHVPPSFWSKPLLRLVAVCCLRPATAGFDVGDVRIHEKLSTLVCDLNLITIATRRCKHWGDQYYK